MADVRRRGLLLVLSSPSGAGKTSISRRLLAEETNLTMSVSVTTRSMRRGEVDGTDYHFIDGARFQAMVADGDLLEHATVFDNSYGTPRGPVLDALKDGRDVLFDVDWQGTQQLRQNALDDLVSIFILPPSVKELERRLFSRAQDPASVVRSRMSRAHAEISHWAEYDYIIVNDDIDKAVAIAESILTAERARRRRQTGLAGFVRDMEKEVLD